MSKQKTICVHNMFSQCSELGIFVYWTCNSTNNLSSYCGLVDAKIRASDKDLPVLHTFIFTASDFIMIKSWKMWYALWMRIFFQRILILFYLTWIVSTLLSLTKLVGNLNLLIWHAASFSILLNTVTKMPCAWKTSTNMSVNQWYSTH